MARSGYARAPLILLVRDGCPPRIVMALIRQISVFRIVLSPTLRGGGIRWPMAVNRIFHVGGAQGIRVGPHEHREDVWEPLLVVPRHQSRAPPARSICATVRTRSGPALFPMRTRCLGGLARAPRANGRFGPDRIAVIPQRRRIRASKCVQIEHH